MRLPWTVIPAAATACRTRLARSHLMVIELREGLLRRAAPVQYFSLDLHIVLDGSHADDAARHLNRPGCVSLRGHVAVQPNHAV